MVLIFVKTTYYPFYDYSNCRRNLAIFGADVSLTKEKNIEKLVGFYCVNTNDE
jgi:hypothetical protein